MVHLRFLLLLFMTLSIWANCCVASFSWADSIRGASYKITGCSATSLWISFCFDSSGTCLAVACSDYMWTCSASCLAASSSLCLASAASLNSFLYAYSSSDVMIVLQSGLVTAFLIVCIYSSWKSLSCTSRNFKSVYRAMTVTSQFSDSPGQKNFH